MTLNWFINLTVSTQLSLLTNYYIVLDKTLKGIRGVRLDNQIVLRAPGPRTKYFKRLFLCTFKYFFIIL